MLFKTVSTKKYTGILMVLALLFSCAKEEFFVSNLNNNKILVLGHGGMGIDQTYPMNTYESIVKCLNLGAAGTEIDVQMTKDSVLVAYHNEDLADKTNLKGIINDLNWSDIENGYYTSTPYLNYSILSLDQLFSNIDNIQDYKFTFDCKLYTNNANSVDFQGSYINAIAKIIDKYNLQNNIYIESEDIAFLQRLQEKDENYKLFIYPSSFEVGLQIALDLNLYGITISTEDITKQQVEIAHSNNLYVALWNTHSKERNTEAVTKNPDIIQTDKVEHLVKLLK
jgi:glycerophosphoryl diester phosphodiesterase